jgi:4-amino-4-deoxy-L-arabinose transferase-like glycosyltransferase
MQSQYTLNNRDNTFKYYLLSIVTLPLTIILLFPHLQHYIDPDATSYFTIIKRYLEQDISGAINAFWSPMGIWLTVLLLKVTSLPLFTAALIINSLASLGTILVSQYIFHKIRYSKFERFCFAVSFSLFWAYATYQQLFTDIWQYFFLLLAICIIWKKDFTQNVFWWIIAGIIGALAYYSKAYAFYYFPLMLLVIFFIKIKLEKNLSTKKAILIFLIIMATMYTLTIPWIYILYQKYGFITSSTSGSLNLSWWLIGKPIHPEHIQILVPPIDNKSLFYFEDPYFSQGEFPKFWHSFPLFFKQIVRIAYNYIDWVKSTNFMSSFYFVVWFLTLISFFAKKISLQHEKQRIIALVFLTFPIGYWLISFQNGRYVWLTIPLLMILGLIYAEKLLFPYINKISRQIFVLVLFLSILPSCITDIKSMATVGHEEFTIGNQLKEMGIKGSFISNKAYMSDQGHFILRTAYFSGCPWYYYGENKWNNRELLLEAKKYDVDYYFYFFNGTTEDYLLEDLNGNKIEDITQNRIKGLKVFPLK